MSSNINLKKQPANNPLGTNPFSYLPPELAVEIAKKLPEKDLRTLALVSKYFRNVTTDNILWKPILECLSNKNEKELTAYSQVNRMDMILQSTSKRKINALLRAELIWRSGKYIVIASPTTRQHGPFQIQLYDYDLDKLHEYQFPQTKLIQGHDDFIFATHPPEKGVHIYELVSGEKIGTIGDNFNSIDHISVIDGVLSIEGKVKEEKEDKKTKKVKIIEKESSGTWKINKKIINFQPKKSKKYKDYQVALNQRTNEIEVKKGEDVINTISKWEYKGLDGYKPISLMKLPKRDVYMMSFQQDHNALKSLPEKVLKSLPPTTHLKLLTCSPSGTIYKEFSFEYEYLHRELSKSENQKKIIKINPPEFKAEIDSKNPIKIEKDGTLIKTLPIDGYESICVLNHTSEDQFIFGLRSIKNKKKFKVITTTSNGTLVSEHFFRLTNLANTFWVSAGKYVWISSDLEKVKQLDLTKPSSEKTNPLKICGRSLQTNTFIGSAHYVKNLSILDHNLVLNGYLINFFSEQYINNTKQLERDAINLDADHFVKVIKLLEISPPKQVKILNLFKKKRT